MSRASQIQNTFNAGEVSPLMYGRQDIEQYHKALATCFNAIPLVQGAWTRRPGTKFVGATKTGTTETSRLFPYAYDVSTNFMVEFGHNYCRVYNSDYSVFTGTAQSITGITKANPAVLTYSGSDTYSNGDRVILNDRSKQ